VALGAILEKQPRAERGARTPVHGREKGPAVVACSQEAAIYWIAERFGGKVERLPEGQQGVSRSRLKLVEAAPA